jgi:hypothetical protein
MICTACGRSGISSVKILKDHGCPTLSDWGRVMKLRQQGESHAADRLARKLLGIRGEPMDEETKEKLRRWKEEHAAQIKVRDEIRRAAQKRQKVLMAPAKALRRKASHG